MLKVCGMMVVKDEHGASGFDLLHNQHNLSAKDIKDILLCQVGPSILPRLVVPRSSTRSTEYLLHRLEAVATPFRLLDLPPELRDKIYAGHFEDVLPEKTVAEINLDTAGGVPKPPLCRVNRQICEETAHLVYGNPLFRFNQMLAGHYHQNCRILGALV